MGIELKTYDGKLISPKLDAILYDSIQKTGILSGCEITHRGTNVLHIASGYGIIKGRLFEITEQEIVAALPVSGTQQGRVYLDMQLGRDDPIEIGCEVADSLSPLEKDEKCNYTQGIYQVELAKFKAGMSSISELLQTAPRVGDSIKITFPAAGWSSSAPYVQTVPADGVTEADDFGMPEVVVSGDSAMDKEALSAAGNISGGTTTDGHLTLFCYDAKPLVDLPLVFTRRRL